MSAEDGVDTATRTPVPGLGSWPRRRARITPERTALLEARRSLTYAELTDRTARLACALRGMGVGPGDRVAYLGVNAVEVFETFFATWLLGAIAVPLNHLPDERWGEVGWGTCSCARRRH